MGLTTDIAAEVLAACSAGAVEASAALSRALDGQLTLTPGAIESLDATPIRGAGLIVLLKVGAEAAIVAIPETTGALPAWYATPDATGVSKLTTLAQELGMLLLPESCMPDDFAAFRVSDLSTAILRAQPASSTSALSLSLSGSASGTAWLVWPITQSANLSDPAPAPATAAATAPAAQKPAARPALRVNAENLEEALPALPSYTRSLLKIRVPIVVTLAKSQQPLSRIVELAPGSIIPFDKSCEDTLSLEVNNREVAIGEAVKVGDKFGLRIISMTLPPERFVPLKSHR
jgi:flagellar motor switch protein FliN/FliY